jgi:alginate O-acetyltransferase complex protein AlgJ
MARILKISVIGLFVLVVLAPILQENLHFVKIAPLQENRPMKERPSDWLGLFKPGMRFAKGFDEYFNDNYGFRNLLIRLKNQMDFDLFHKSDKVLIGRDGYLFYKSVVEEDEVRIEKISASRWDRLCSRLLKFNRILASRGITLVLVPCPMKNSIYPEKAPANAPRRPNPTTFQRHLAFLRAHPEIVSVDPFPLLVKLKDSFQVYYKTDFHWTEAAGAYAARDLVRRLGSLSGKQGLWDQPIQIDIREAEEGGEGHSLALLWKLAEMAPFPAGAGMDEKRGSYNDGRNAYEWTYTSKLQDKSGLIPDTVMFGDSYSDAFLRAGFAGYFSKIQRYFNWDFSRTYYKIPDGVRFVILQYCEPVIMLDHEPFWPKELRND